MIEEADRDNDGEVSYEEFVDIMKKNIPLLKQIKGNLLGLLSFSKRAYYNASGQMPGSKNAVTLIARRGLLFVISIYYDL